MHESLLVVGIVGCDFSGSTILSAVLDGLEGVQSVGETHWILDRGLHCRECCPGDDKCMWNSDCECDFDPNCPVFTAEVLASLHAIPEAARPAEWWKTIGESAQATVIISSDKRPSHFERLGLPDQYIFTYKDPVSHVFSRAKRLSVEHGTERILDEQVAEGVEWLVFNSEFRIDFLKEYADSIALVNNENFSRDPRAGLSTLAGFLGVHPDLAVLEYWNHDHHYIGGNFSVRQKVAAEQIQHVVEVDGAALLALTESQQDMIRSDQRITALERRIEELSARPGAVCI